MLSPEFSHGLSIASIALEGMAMTWFLMCVRHDFIRRIGLPVLGFLVLEGLMRNADLDSHRMVLGKWAAQEVSWDLRRIAVAVTRDFKSFETVIQLCFLAWAVAIAGWSRLLRGDLDTPREPWTRRDCFGLIMASLVGLLILASVCNFDGTFKCPKHAHGPLAVLVVSAALHSRGAAQISALDQYFALDLVSLLLALTSTLSLDFDFKNFTLIDRGHDQHVLLAGYLLKLGVLATYFFPKFAKYRPIAATITTALWSGIVFTMFSLNNALTKEQYMRVPKDLLGPTCVLYLGSLLAGGVPAIGIFVFMGAFLAKDHLSK